MKRVEREARVAVMVESGCRERVLVMTPSAVVHAVSSELSSVHIGVAGRTRCRGRAEPYRGAARNRCSLVARGALETGVAADELDAEPPGVSLGVGDDGAEAGRAMARETAVHATVDALESSELPVMDVAVALCTGDGRRHESSRRSVPRMALRARDRPVGSIQFEPCSGVHVVIEARRDEAADPVALAATPLRCELAGVGVRVARRAVRRCRGETACRPVQEVALGTAETGVGPFEREPRVGVAFFIETARHECRDRVTRAAGLHGAELAGMDVGMAVAAGGRRCREAANVVDQGVAGAAVDVAVGAVEREVALLVPRRVERARHEVIIGMACAAPAGRGMAAELPGVWIVVARGAVIGAPWRHGVGRRAVGMAGFARGVCMGELEGEAAGCVQVGGHAGLRPREAFGRGVVADSAGVGRRRVTLCQGGADTCDEAGVVSRWVTVAAGAERLGRRGVDPVLVTLGAREAGMHVLEREDSGMLERRDGGEGVVLAVAGRAVRSEAALVHVLVTRGAGLCQAAESALSGGQRRRIGVDVAGDTVEVGMAAVQVERRREPMGAIRSILEARGREGHRSGEGKRCTGVSWMAALAGVGPNGV